MTRLQRIVRPPDWLPGMRVGIVSPGSDTAYRFPGRARRGAAHLASALGADIQPMAPMVAAAGYRAMPPQEVARELHSMFADPGIGLIVVAIGGFNSNAVLAHLDWDLLARHPTHLCGYSDASALLLAIHAMTGQIVLHGPALLPQWGDPRGPFPQTIDALRHALCGEADRVLEYAGFWVDPRTDWSNDLPERSFRDTQAVCAPWTTLQAGHARGRLIGGNIETVNMLVGTPWMPDFDDRIVFVEATGAEAYLPRLHRALTHLRDAGIFDTARGLIVGRCPDAAPIAGVALVDVIREAVAGYEFPVVLDVDIGHTEPMLTLPVGGEATLSADPDAPRIVLHR
jgi:muramoyltetrapeptide carboxypeptidase